MGEIMSSDTLNTVTRNAVMDVFHRKGKFAADEKVRELLRQCESWKDRQQERSTIKGELSEVALEYHLLWWLSQVSPLTCIKSLCMKSKTSDSTAEIDILLASPFKIYLFECKSFKGEKTVTQECFLQGSSSSKDVYKQSKHHLRILEEHISCCRPVLREPIKIAPYQLVLFELSSNDLDDQRSDKWKKAIPALTLDTLDEWLLTEFSKNYCTQWDYEKLVPILKYLDSISEQTFKFHMAKILSRR